ncbi:MAG: hypothetical protein KC445_18880 [Anaerolineales bacterium]|nr:hypothetical protein [Anaerolineales bacterium]
MSLIIVGIFPIGIFLLIWFGVLKSWYILKTLPGLLSGRMMYAALPFGISFLLSGIVASLPNYNGREPGLLNLTLLIGPVFGFWFMYRPPRWIKPSWLQWLEQEYGYCLPILLEEGQKMNRWQWEAQVRTRAGMQTWIDNVFAHRREDIEFAWQTEKFALIAQKTDVIKPGMIAKGDVPVHRRDDVMITREEIDAVVAVQNAQYRPDEKYIRR